MRLYIVSFQINFDQNQFIYIYEYTGENLAKILKSYSQVVLLWDVEDLKELTAHLSMKSKISIEYL